MNRHDSVSVIVPMLNEAASLEELYLRIRDALAGACSFEFIAVDDGSTDDTLEVLKRLRAQYSNICVLSHYRNHGKSLALMQGFSVARGETAVVMDADLQDQPEMIPRLLEKLAEGYDLVNGWRSARQDPFAKRLVSKTFNALTSSILNCPLHDINCGMKVMRRRVYQRLQLRGDLHRLIPAIVATQGFKVTEVPVTHAPRKFGRSKYRLLRHRGLLDIIALIATRTTQIRPFHVFSEMGILFWIAAFVALLAWAALTAWSPVSGMAFQLLRPLVGVLGMGAAFLGIMLPLLGFHLEVTTSQLQDERWRAGLLKEQLDTRTGDYEIRIPTERVSQERRRTTLPESDRQPVSLGA